jgi:hypothetical protein
VDLLKNPGLELMKSINEITHLQLRCKLTHSSLKAAERNAPDPTATYAEIISLKKQVLLILTLFQGERSTVQVERDQEPWSCIEK